MRSFTTPRHAAPAARRRTLAGVGALGLLGGSAMIGIAGLTSPARAATSPVINYDCKVTLGSIGPIAGVFKVQVSVNGIPSQVTAGDTVSGASLSATVTTPPDQSALLYGATYRWVGGTSTAQATIGNASGSISGDAALTVPITAIPNPADASLVTVASGDVAPITVPDRPGTYTISAGPFKANLQAYGGSTKPTPGQTGTPLTLDCTPQTGSNTAIQDVTVVSAAPTSTTTAPTSSSTSTTSSSSTSTTTSTTTAPTSTTTAPTSTTTAPTSTTTAPTSTSTAPTSTSTTTPVPTTTSSSPASSTSTMGDPTTAPSTPSTVQTDGGTSGDGIDLWTIGGVGAAAAGLVALAGAALSARRED